MANKVNTSSKTPMEPQARMKYLTEFGNVVQVDNNVPLKRYYRSGMEMVRMANVYQKEGNIENAFILYIKFTTLFVERVPAHPEYKSFDMMTRKQNIDKVKEIFPVAEKLKSKLLKRFEEEYLAYLKLEAQHVREIELERLRREEEAKKHPTNVPAQPINDQIHGWPVPTAPNLDQINYPNDGPSQPPKAIAPRIPTADGDRSQPGPTPARPAFDRSLKPDSEPTSLLEGFLRQIVVPEDTMSKFLALAHKNTVNNVETCGILAGRLSYNRLIVTHVIVPKQSGTSDSCTTMNEEDIFDIQDQQNLITLGWIHTHPSQTAFLSSVDLHTHCSYQIMMPEALAIVCAPKYNTTGFFCLTPGYGLEYIAQCRQNGFHPHPNDPPLFMDATHTVIDKNIRCEVIDLRR